MHFQVKVTLSASEAAQKYPPEIKKAAKKALKDLSRNPDIGKELQAELSGFRSFRFNRYRIVYKTDIHRKHIIVWAIGHRRDIYEKLGEQILQQNAPNGG